MATASSSSGGDAARGAEVLARLREDAPGLDHRFLPADLSLLGDTARLVDQVDRCTDTLDAAVLCAGVLATVPEETSEGLERAFVLNYLSRYLLGRRLLPALAAAPPGRLVLVANAGRYRDTLDLHDLHHRRGRPGLAVAGRTQFANDLFAVELAERVAGTGVQVSCVDPGLARTDVFRNARGPGRLVRGLALLTQRVLAAEVDVVAATPAWLAQHPAAADAGGRFWSRGRREKAIPPRVRRADRRTALWRVSEHLVAAHLPAGPVRSPTDRRPTALRRPDDRPAAAGAGAAGSA